jgi:hypothetical protein
VNGVICTGECVFARMYIKEIANALSHVVSKHYIKPTCI